MLYRHVLRNALLNIVSAFGHALGVVGGVLILATVAIALANLLTDITYGILDPRIKTI